MKLLVVFFAILGPALGGEYTYTIKTVTATEEADGKDHSGTNRIIQVSLQGNDGYKTEFICLDNENKDDFVHGATDEFHIESDVSVEHIKCIVLKNKGDDYWLLDRVSVIINAKSTTFYNIDLVGLSNDHGEGRDELTLCACSKYSYVIKTITAPKGVYGRSGTGTDGYIQVSVQDEDEIHKTEFIRLDIKGVDDLESGATDIFLIHSDTLIKKVKCLVFRNTGGDYWLMDKVVINNNGRPTTFYNYDAVALSTDADEGKPELKMCVQGNTSYALTVVTSASSHYDSDNMFISVTIKDGNGAVGRASLIGDAIASEGSHKFYFSSLPLLNVKCITLKANKGRDDVWEFDRVFLYTGGSKVLEVNAPNTKLSFDTEKGQKEVELCSLS